MEAKLNIGHSVLLKSGLLGTIIETVANDPTQVIVRDENFKVDKFYLSDLTPDLFEHPDSLPDEVRDIILAYGEDDDMSYEQCRNMLAEVQACGYTFEYYLDAVPYSLRKIEA